MDNTTLCSLIQQALDFSDEPNRLRAIEALALAIDQLPELKKYLGQGWLPYYEKALPTTQRDIQRNINKFAQMYRLNLESIDLQNPSEVESIRKCFIQWVTMILKRDCHDVKRGKPLPISIDKPIRDNKGSVTVKDTIPDPRLSGLEAYLEHETVDISKKLREYIKLDHDCQLRKCHVRNRPEVNCQTLLELRFFAKPPLTLKSISEKLQQPLQTIKSRLERNCLPIMKDVAIKFGYN